MAKIDIAWLLQLGSYYEDNTPASDKPFWTGVYRKHASLRNSQFVMEKYSSIHNLCTGRARDLIHPQYRLISELWQKYRLWTSQINA